MCGQAARELPYRQSGPGCLERSATKRLEDTAIHIYMYQKCGSPKFSAELEIAAVKIMKFMEKLSVCVSENVNLDKIMQERMLFVMGRAATLKCTSALRAKLRKRRGAFETLIKESRNLNEERLFEKMGVRIDGGGNVRDRY